MRTPMKSFPPFELVVIGGGSAGHSAAAEAARLGLRCALIEDAAELGGLCILRGCMPSKTLIETSNRMRAIREAAEFGIRAAGPEVDLEKLRDRLSRFTADFQQARIDSMNRSGYELIRAKARFVSPQEVEVVSGGEARGILHSRAFVIATGSSPSIPDIPGLAGSPFWTSDDAVRMTRLPRHVAVVGAGAIGMEFAHFYEGMGCRVSVVARGDRLMERHDRDLSEALERASRERGIELLFQTNISRVRHEPEAFLLDLDTGRSLEADALLIATGRTPNVSGLGLEDIGIVVEKGSIVIDERTTTSLPHVFAAGDCASPVPVVHLAVIQGEVAARNAARMIRGEKSVIAATWNRSSAMTAWFTEPQCVEIGTGERTAEQNGIRIVTGRENYGDNGKGMIAGSRHGFVKVIAERESGRLIGAVGAGPQVAETGHLLQFAIERGMTIGEYLALPHYHPTFADAWSRAVEDAKRKAPTEDSP